MMSGVGWASSPCNGRRPIVSGFLLGYVAVLPLIGRLADLLPPAAGAAGLPGGVRRRLGRHRAGGGAAGAGRRPGAAGRRRWRPRAGDARARRRPLAAATAAARRSASSARCRSSAACSGRCWARRSWRWRTGGRSSGSTSLLGAAAGRRRSWVTRRRSRPRCRSRRRRRTRARPVRRRSCVGVLGLLTLLARPRRLVTGVTTGIPFVPLVGSVAGGDADRRRRAWPAGRRRSRCHRPRWWPVLRRADPPGAAARGGRPRLPGAHLRLGRPRAGGRRAPRATVLLPVGALAVVALPVARAAGPPHPLVPRGVVRGRVARCARRQPARRRRAGGRRRRRPAARPAHASRHADHGRPRARALPAGGAGRCARSVAGCCGGSATGRRSRRRRWSWPRPGWPSWRRGARLARRRCAGHRRAGRRRPGHRPGPRPRQRRRARRRAGRRTRRRQLAGRRGPDGRHGRGAGAADGDRAAPLLRGGGAAARPAPTPAR